MPFKKGHKVEPHWHRPVGAENGLSTEAKDVLVRAYTEFGDFEGFCNWCRCVYRKPYPY